MVLLIIPHALNETEVVTSPHGGIPKKNALLNCDGRNVSILGCNETIFMT